MKAAPVFSIVVPTRNRAGLLRRALESALAQSAGDFEVVVSDNASVDDTRDVAAAAGDRRVRYVRSDQMLSQPDSWEFAFAHVRGEWVTLLSDDDAILPTLLERVEELIEKGVPRVVAYRKAWYVHPDLDPPWPAEVEVNHLFMRPCSGAVEEVDARAELARFFRREEREAIPGISNAVVHRSVLDRLRGEAGRLFRYPDPAAVACAGFLALEPSYLAVELPLNVEGLSRVNVSSGYRHAVSETHPVVQEYHADELFTEVPLRSKTMANAAAESLLRAKRSMPERFSDLELDAARYFVTVHAELTDPARSAGDVEAVAEWRAAVRRQPAPVRAAVRRAAVRRRLRAAGRRTAPLRALARAAKEGAGIAPGLYDFDGTERGFSDIVGAARFLDAEVCPALDPAPA